MKRKIINVPVGDAKIKAIKSTYNSDNTQGFTIEGNTLTIHEGYYIPGLYSPDNKITGNIEELIEYSRRVKSK